MIISICGPSGSGKTTLISEIKKSPIFRGKDITLKAEDQFILINIFRHIFGNKLFRNYKRVKFYGKKPTRQVSTFSKIVKIFYPLIIYVDFLWDHIYYEVLFKNKVLIKDKYIYGYITTFKEVLRIDTPLINYIYRKFPKPYIAIFLEIDAKTAISRNKNTAKNLIASKQSFQKRVLSSHVEIARACRLLIVDSRKGVSKTKKEILKLITTKSKLTKIKTLTISGLDGSGKTTLAGALADKATTLGISSKVVHFYHDNIPYKLLKMTGVVRNEKPTKNSYTKNRAIAKLLQKKGKSLLWAGLTFFDSYVQYLFSRVLHFNKLIVYDRFFYDYLVSFKFLRINTIFFTKFLPKADRSFLVSVDPTIAYKRKPENIKDFYIQGAKEYFSISKQFGIKTIKADSKSPDEVLDKLLNTL